MNENRQIFVNTYLTNNYNGTAAYKIAYPNCKSGHKQAASRLLTMVDVKKAIDKKLKAIHIAWEDRVTKVITRLQAEIEDTDSVSALCLLVNAQKGYMDMQAKNEGKYGADNAQRTEEAKLTEVQVEEAKRYAKWRLVQDLTEPIQVINKPLKLRPNDISDLRRA